MKHIGLLILLLLCNGVAFSQEADHVNSGKFLKRIEYNASNMVIIDENGNRRPDYNLESKTPLDKIFFGLTNSPMECIVSSPKGQAGLRLLRNSKDGSNWRLEVFPMDHYEAASLEVMFETEKIEIPLRILDRLPKDQKEHVLEHNKKIPWTSKDEDTYKPYRPQSKTFTVDDLGYRLYYKTVALIDNFKAEGEHGIFADGQSVTFRCVVGDELWSLRIHIPQKRALQMSDLCRQIIEDAQADEFDEQKYVRMLEPIDF